MTEKIGMEAVWDNTNFNKGQAEYIKGLSTAETATGGTSDAINNLGQGGQSTGSIFSNLAGMLGISTGQMFSLAGAIGIGVAAFKTISSAVGDFISYMVTGEDSAIKVASRLQELNIAAQAMGQQVGLNGVQVNAMVKQLNGMDISLTSANSAITEFSRYGLNMAQITDLATVAQNASIITNKSASETMDDLVTGIERMMVRQLKSSGIVMNAADAYQAYADQLGKDKDQLTETEQQQAFLNAVIEKGANLQGLYAVGMQTAQAQMNALTSKGLPDLKSALGAPFEDAFFNVAKGISEIVSAITAMVSEGGSLYPIMVELGAIFQVITEPLVGLGNALTDFTDNKLSAFGTNIQATINNAITWGANLVTNFAVGMINAAGTALTMAINYIGSLLTSWFAPGSPPKILPQIDVWGSETMDEYLKGFTEADFNILEGLQNPIRDALSSLSDMGTISQQAANDLYVSLSEGMIKALAGGGLTTDLLAQITAAGGIYGDELADLATKEFALAGSEKAVTDAEKALTDAKKRSTDAGVAVNQGMMEYNQMLRGGASKQELSAKLAQINAAKKEQASANKDIDAKQTALDLAKQQLIATQDQIQAIKDMLKVMIDLNKAQLAAATPPVTPTPATPVTPPGGGGGAGGVTVPTGGVTPFDPTKISSALTDAIGKAVDDIKERFKLAWGSIEWAFIKMKTHIILALEKSGIPEFWDKIKEAAGTAWQYIQEQAGGVVMILQRWWSKYGSDVKIIWDGILQVINHIVEGIGKVIAWLLPNAILIFTGIWDFVRSTFGLILDFIGSIFSTIAALITGDTGRIGEIWGTFLQNMINWGDKLWAAVEKVFSGLWGMIGGYLTDLWNGIVTYFTTWWDFLFGASFFPDMLAAIIKFITDFIAQIGLWMTGIWTTITTIAATISTDWNTFWDTVSQKATDIWNAISTWVSTKITEAQTTITNITNAIGAAWIVFWDGVKQKVSDIWDAISTYVSTKISEAQTTISTISGDIQSAWDTFWDTISTKVTTVWDAIKTGIDTKVTEIKDAVAAIFTGPDGLFAKFAGWVSDMVTHGKDLIGGLVTGVTSAAQGLIDTVVGAVRDAIGAAEDFLHIPHSPSGLQLLSTYGGEMMSELQHGIEANINLPSNAMRGAMVQTIAPAASVPVTMGATTNYYQPNFNIPTTINNGMNAVVFQEMIKRTVRNEINRK
jgi:phage-related protein